MRIVILASAYGIAVERLRSCLKQTVMAFEQFNSEEAERYCEIVCGPPESSPDPVDDSFILQLLRWKRYYKIELPELAEWQQKRLERQSMRVKMITGCGGQKVSQFSRRLSSDNTGIRNFKKVEA
jgi:hypothetical protein